MFNGILETIKNGIGILNKDIKFVQKKIPKAKQTQFFIVFI